MFAILSFFYGASLGSFTQVLVTRLHVASILNGRSKCLSCGEKLRWFDLIPVLSYLVLRGKCRTCKNSFGKEHLFVEILFGAVFVLVYYLVLAGRGVNVSSLLWLIYYSALSISLGAITLYDLRHRLVPGFFFVVFLLLSLIAMVLRYATENDPYTFLAPVLVASPFIVAFLVTKGRALGFGDILMYLAVGAFFGLEQGLAVLFLSVWIGGMVALILHIKNNTKYGMKYALPFVPFITVAFLIVLFTDIDVISIGQALTGWYY
ncbi:MAG: leader peptidase (prepilin peptidase) / N-methyltransferase [Patescibacteria group bacterium]|nr:leader peptidase (prepilin peptidase) / N-methyltransferase [Patescibacteria group bacterium]